MPTPASSPAPKKKRRPSTATQLAQMRADSLLRMCATLAARIERSRPRHRHAPEVWARCAEALRVFALGMEK